MTREEQIITEAKKHYYDDINCHNAFLHGVEWADEHPANVWQEASEEPQSNHKNIIYQTNYHSMYNVHIDFIPTCLRSCKITSRSWDEFVKEVNMRRWAYINDLLPKQFGNK